MRIVELSRRLCRLEIAFVVVSTLFLVALTALFYMLLFADLPALEYYTHGASICV